MKKNNIGHQSHEELQNLICQKEAAIQAKGRLIDNMAYQIRTLSNAVIGFSDLLLTEDLQDELLEYVKEINQAGNGLSSLVNEVLDWAQLESGRLQVAHTPFELSCMITHLEEVVSSAAQDKGLDYRFEIDPDLPSRIVGDYDRLLRCLLNLIMHAFKHTAKGSVGLRFLLERQDGKSYLRIDISDGGAGVEPEKIDRLFEPALSRQDANSEILTMLDMGFTLTAGLPLTKQLIELLGGTLEVTSELNVGTISIVRLPLENEADNAAHASPILRHESKPEGDSAACASVLLVEDQPSNRTVISLMLEMLGASVDTAEDGQEGVEKASQKRYDLILMDLKMPRMDGYQAARKIREMHSGTPITALSAKVLSEAENQEINALFDGFLTKPVDSHTLSETLQKFIPRIPLTTAGCPEKTPDAAEGGGHENPETVNMNGE